MNVTDANAATNSTHRSDSESRASHESAILRQASQNVESMFLSILLKEGLKMESEEGQDTLGNTESLQEFAVEQMAQELSQNGGIGIADMIYEQLSDR